ncbi:MAG: asparagine synthetase B, partial [Candidatus Kapabacteria bacterium]|nr:asparagine synthetase B [Candidatus Kapabacteria bacterium]MDW7996060.1 asparagine synthetase B [Bacteroidota bacterium]
MRLHLRSGAMVRVIVGIVGGLLGNVLWAQHGLLIPMDLGQSNHLRAYGIAYWNLQQGRWVDWLLNYRGGSFLLEYASEVAMECRIRGVSFEVLSAAEVAQLYAEVQSPDANMDVIRLERAPRLAVYVMPTAKPWADA